MDTQRPGEEMTGPLGPGGGADWNQVSTSRSALLPSDHGSLEQRAMNLRLQQDHLGAFQTQTAGAHPAWIPSRSDESQEFTSKQAPGAAAAVLGPTLGAEPPSSHQWPH